MCMLCVIPPNVIPSKDKLQASAINNPHGFGFAIVVAKERRIIVEKTMNPDTAVNKFLELRAQYPEDYAMWHARLATHGSMTLDNCHPFQVENEMTYLGHNGILSVLEDKTDRSDTRIFAEDVLTKMGGVTALDNEQLYNMIEEFTSGSKLCILTVDPRAQYQCYLVHQDKGKFDQSGVWWSNDSCSWDYNWYSSSKTNSYDYASSGASDLVECSQCKGILDDYMIEYGMCEYCNTCIDCGSDYELCLCYDPDIKGKANEKWFAPANKEVTHVKGLWEGVDW